MKTSSTSIRHRNGAALAHVAILVAGQIRTFEERAVQLNLHDKLVKPNQADVYFSLSPEDSPADWYNRYLFPQNKSVQLSSTIGADRLGSTMTSVRAFDPYTFRLQMTATSRGSNRHSGTGSCRMLIEYTSSRTWSSGGSCS